MGKFTAAPSIFYTESTPIISDDQHLEEKSDRTFSGTKSVFLLDQSEILAYLTQLGLFEQSKKALKFVPTKTKPFANATTY